MLNYNQLSGGGDGGRGGVGFAGLCADKPPHGMKRILVWDSFRNFIR